MKHAILIVVLAQLFLNPARTYAQPDSIRQAIASATNTYSLQDLTEIVRAAVTSCNQSTDIATLLVGWMKENHRIYSGRLPSSSNQFRAFLLASLSRFPPTEDIYQYVKAELLFPSHAINIAAAALTAKNFPERSDELIPLLEPFLTSSFTDQLVDLTTPQLSYPISHPTKARYEIITTLLSFGPAAYSTVGQLNEIAQCGYCSIYGSDSSLALRAKNAAASIIERTPPCCRKETATTTPKPGKIKLLDRKDRNIRFPANLDLSDQEGTTLTTNNLSGRPFLISFFDTQCTNQTKCVATVQRLRDLESLLAKNNLSGKIGIYGITYDPDFDTPPILKKYGQMYGVTFGKSMRFLQAAGNSNNTLISQLQVRVNYGAGTVNQHGIQLFLFDKNSRLAGICDNDRWDIKDAYARLLQLAKE